jgi:hypothetical protein
MFIHTILFYVMVVERNIPETNLYQPRAFVEEQISEYGK